MVEVVLLCNGVKSELSQPRGSLFGLAILMLHDVLQESTTAGSVVEGFDNVVLVNGNFDQNGWPSNAKKILKPQEAVVRLLRSTKSSCLDA